MLTAVHPKLPMRDKILTKQYYCHRLDFTEIADYGDYLMLKKDKIEIHFFAFVGLNPNENYGQIYLRADRIEALYQELLDH
jgi:hypothetical protein